MRSTVNILCTFMHLQKSHQRQNKRNYRSKIKTNSFSQLIVVVLKCHAIGSKKVSNRDRENYIECVWSILQIHILFTNGPVDCRWNWLWQGNEQITWNGMCSCKNSRKKKNQQLSASRPWYGIFIGIIVVSKQWHSLASYDGMTSIATLHWFK